MTMTKPVGIELAFPFPEPPAPGEAVEIDKGVLWLRLPLPMALDHVNIYALDDGEKGWTILDTGADNPGTRQLWEQILAGPLGGRPVWRVIVSHFHPDHAGLATFFVKRGAQLWTTRATYLMVRMLCFDVNSTHPDTTLRFWRESGMDQATWERCTTERPFNMSALIEQFPPGFYRMKEGDRITAGGRDWIVRLGEGHAPEQASLWQEDGPLVLSADLILPSISPNVSAFPAEPLADPIRELIDSCARLAEFARPDHLVLPGHKLPFTGLPLRLWQMAENHHDALDRLHGYLATPKVAVECFSVLFRREVTAQVFGLALGETIAHLNSLLLAGRVRREKREDGAWLWQAI